MEEEIEDGEWIMVLSSLILYSLFVYNALSTILIYIMNSKQAVQTPNWKRALIEVENDGMDSIKPHL